MTVSNSKKLLNVYNHDYKIKVIVVVFLFTHSTSLVQTWNKQKDEFNWLVILPKEYKNQGGSKKSIVYIKGNGCSD